MMSNLCNDSSQCRMRGISPIPNPHKQRSLHMKSSSLPQSSLDSSRSSITSELQRILNASLRKEPMQYEEYLTWLKDSMDRYRNPITDCPLIKGINENKEYITKEEQQIKQAYNINHSFNLHLYNPSDESLMKVAVKENAYKNPFQSLKVLKKNHRIHDDVNQTFLERQKQLFDEAIEKYESYVMKYRVKMPKIKIRNVMPKTHRSNDEEKLSEEETHHHLKKNEKEKAKERMSMPAIPSQEYPKLFGFYRYANKNFPEGREQFGLSVHSSKEIVLVGGMGSTLKSNIIWSLNPESLEWRKIASTNIAPVSRYGHSGIAYQGKIYIFGGRSKYSNSNLIGDFEMFDLEENSWSSPYVYTKSSLKVRRNHVADLIGQQMIIHGGVSESNEYLNDAHLLNLSPLKWIYCHISDATPGPALAGHACALVIPSEIRYNTRFNVYKFPELGIGKQVSNNRVAEKGWYIFGGKSKDEDGLSNDLWILKIGKKPLDWVKRETAGKPPCPRCFHSMNFFEPGNFLIIHGGRNDHASDSFALSDTFVLDLEKFNWIEVSVYSTLPEFRVLSRCGHSSAIYSNKLIIFGGMNSNNYVGSSLFVINLDFYYRPNVLSEEEASLQALMSMVDEMTPEVRIKIEKLKRLIQKNQLAIVPEIILPPIK